MNDPLKR